jgi:hypothetical protein
MEYDKYILFDARKFDSSINTWMVKLAIRICRNQSFEGMHSRYDTYWNFIEESLLRPTIYRDDASGHSHNTLLQSTITLLLAYAAVAALCPHLTQEEIMANIWVESLGDDNIIGLRGPLAHPTLEDIAGWVLKNIGVE